MAAGGSVPKSAFEQNFDPEFMFNLYFRLDCPFAEDTVAKGLKALEEAFTTYAVKGDLLIGINNNPTVHQYISASKYFKEIIATNYSKRCLQQLVKWLKNDPGAYDYSHIFKYACKLEDDSDNWMEIQDRLRRKIKHTAEHDVCKSDPLAPHVFPQADCLITEYCLETIFFNKDAYCTGLKNMSSLLRVGGHLLMTGVIARDYTSC
ncbi:indolethylamine N-methyltransferase-like isoform X1 [Lissotriton helveticus]